MEQWSSDCVPGRIQIRISDARPLQPDALVHHRRTGSVALDRDPEKRKIENPIRVSLNKRGPLDQSNLDRLYQTVHDVRLSRSRLS
jgi:hypothetical protein